VTATAAVGEKWCDIWAARSRGLHGRWFMRCLHAAVRPLAGRVCRLKKGIVSGHERRKSTASTAALWLNEKSVYAVDQLSTAHGRFVIITDNFALGNCLLACMCVYIWMYYVCLSVLCAG